jgi:NADH:ubiquinone oxidoreductase subunit 6 (subunit J)
MRNLLKYSLLALIVSFVGSTAAFGAAGVPEVDPSMAITGVALLAGAVTVLRGRRSK